MPQRPTIVLVHSPLVGPHTWAGVAAALDEAGLPTIVPELNDDARAPYAMQHAASVVEALPGSNDVVLVAHSGAGPLLPLIADEMTRKPLAAIFVDAGLPIDGTTRLEQLSLDSPEIAVEFRRHLGSGGRFPEWTDDDLANLVADLAARGQLLDSLHPRTLDFFTERLAIPPIWAGVPCGYVRTSADYDVWARIALQRGWPVADLDGGHFQLLTDPRTVAGAIIAVLDQLAPAPKASMSVDSVRYDDRGLVPAIVQQHDTGEVLMLAWMNADTLAETLKRKETVFWSRSRQERWHKGETSGNVQRVVDVVADCDADVVLVRVDQTGEGACHTGAWSCFHQPVQP